MRAMFVGKNGVRMGLTREECLIAWNTIKGLEDYPIECTVNEAQDKFKTMPFNELFNDEINLIDNLIKEYLDNPPLKFEELEEGMWVWDNEEKRYGRVTPRSHCEHGLLSTPGVCWGVFEDNRFYRYEVKND